jgi:asparagine synthase (glutamine-hydrolysing)
VINVPWLTLEPPDPPDSVQRVLDSARRLPSSIDRAIAWNSILETMPHMFPAATVRYEYRYPLLDRDLVEFLLRLPPEQIRRPGQRRFLMKRSLGPVLPPEVLGRTRKASLKRGPILLLEQRREAIETLFRDSLLAEAGYVDAKRLLASVPPIRKGESQILRPALMRTLQLEIWLRSKPPLN